MLTVAKNLNAPIKLLFPIDLAAVPPKLSLLGLGDIVIPVNIYNHSLIILFKYLYLINIYLY